MSEATRAERVRVALDALVKRNSVLIDHSDGMKIYLDVKETDVDIKADFSVKAKHNGERLTQAQTVI